MDIRRYITNEKFIDSLQKYISNATELQLKQIEENVNTGKSRIIVTELPYQVNKAQLLQKIAELQPIRKFP